MFRTLLLTLTVLMLQHLPLNAQTTFFTEDFEASVNTWSVSGTAATNRWVVGTCTDNGGSKSAYVTSGGTTPDCSPTGIEHYGYTNSASGTEQVFIYKAVNAGCYNNMTLSFDLQIDGTAGQDFLQTVYSTDNGATWTAVGTAFSGIPTYAPQSIALPAALNQTTFLLGFRFDYNNTTVTGNAPSVDNVEIEGTFGDTQAPQVTCPTSITLYTETQCKGVITDISAVATISDNCSTLGNLTISQTPAIGAITLVDVTGTLTVTDEEGLSGQCTTQFILVDTMAPVVTCPANHTLGSNASCNYTVEDLSSLVDMFDECSTTFTVTQTPTIGTNLANGTYTVNITAEDESGNSASCAFQLNVVDTIAPQLTCPASVQVYGNTLCNGDITNQLPFVTATDNCSSSANLTFLQDLAPGHNFLATDTLTVSAEDEAGNVGTCLIVFHVIDTVAPIVTCPDDTVVNTSNPCSFTVPNLVSVSAANDYCTPNNLLTFSQTPIAGSAASGVLDIQVMYTDTAGNQGTCITHVLPIDTQDPTITCPSTQTFNTGGTCNTTLPDLTGLATVNDNCGAYTFTQSPAAGAIVNSGTNVITITITDAAGNNNSCSFGYRVIENIGPQITCPSNSISCDPHVVYNSPSATDNCLFIMTQTDATGFTSGSIFPVGITTQTYMVVDSSGNSATCSFTVQVLDYPDTAHVTVDSIGLCEEFSTPISADAIQSGTGSWQIISGSGTIADPTQNVTSVSGLGMGTTKIVWTVSSATCGQLRDTLTVIVSAPSSPAILTDTMVVCYENGSVIQGNIPTSGIGTWFGTAGITFSDIHAPVVQIYNVPEGFNEILWFVQSYGCPFNVDTAVLFRPFSASITTPDTLLCTEDLPLALDGSAIGYHQTAYWSVEEGQATLDDYLTPHATLVAGTAGLVQLNYTTTQAGCPASTDVVIVSLQNCTDAFSDPSTIFTPNGDGKNDYFMLGNLNQLHPDAEVVIVNRWGSVVFESLGYAEPWDGTHNGEPLPMGTYFYSITSPTSAFEKITGSISIIR